MVCGAMEGPNSCEGEDWHKVGLDPFPAYLMPVGTRMFQDLYHERPGLCDGN